MAPEQAFGQTASISPLVDVYALGAILYECLTGRPPFRAATVIDTLDQVRHQPPVPPRQLQPKVPADLDIICLKCLEKSPSSRYVSALALAEDLRRFLADEPIKARATGVWERGWRWAKRRPAVSTLAIVSVVLLVAGLSAAIWQYRTTSEALESARTNLYANRIALARTHLREGHVDRAQELLDECPEDLRGWEWNYLQRQCQPQLQREQLEVGITTTQWHLSPDGTQLAGLGTEGVQLRSLAGGTARRLEFSAGKDAEEQWFGLLTFNSTGRYVSTNRGKQVRVWSVHDGELVGKLETKWGMATVDPMGRRAIEGRDVVDVATGERVATLELPSGQPAQGAEFWAPSSLAFTTDGKLVYASHQQGLDCWEVETGKHQRRMWEQPASQLAISPNGSALAAITPSPNQRSYETRVWNLHQPQSAPLVVRRGDGMVRPAFSPDGKRLVVVGSAGSLRLWDLAAGQEMATYPGRQNETAEVVFTADSSRLLTLSRSGELRQWDATTCPESRTLAPTATLGGFSPDGRWYVAGGQKGIELYDVVTGTLRRTFGPPVESPDAPALVLLGGAGDVVRQILYPQITALSLNADGSRLATLSQPQAMFSEDAKLSVWDTANGSLLFQEPVEWHSGHLAEMAWNVTGDRLAITRRNFKAPNNVFVLVLDVNTRDKVLNVEVPATVVPTGKVLTFSPDGRRLALVAYELLKATVMVWDLESKQQLFKVPSGPLPLTGVQFSSDGKLVKGVGIMGSTLFDAESGRQIDLKGQQPSVLFLPNGRFLRLVPVGDGMEVFEGTDSKRRCFLKDYHGDTQGIVSPDGRRVVALGQDIKIWDLQTGQEVLTLNRPETEPQASELRFSTDGRRLMYGSTVWDARPIERPGKTGEDESDYDRIDRSRFWTSVLVFLLAFFPVIYLTRLYSLAVRVRFLRRNGFLPTSFGLGSARPMLMTNWGGCKVALSRSSPLRPFLSVSPLSRFPTHGQRLWINTAHFLTLAVTAGAFFLLWRYVNFGWEISSLATIALGIAACPGAGRTAWQSVRGDSEVALTLEPIVQRRLLRGVWKWIGDSTGLYLQNMRAAAVWAELGAVAEAKSLLAEADALPVEHTAFTQAFGGTVRGLVLSASGDHDAATTALHMAEMGFGALEDEDGRLWVGLCRARLLRRQAKVAEARGLLDSLQQHPIADTTPEVRARIRGERLLCALQNNDTDAVPALTVAFEAERGLTTSALSVWQRLTEYHQSREEKLPLQQAQKHATALAGEIYAGLGDETDRRLFHDAQPHYESVYDTVEDSDNRREEWRVWRKTHLRQAVAFLLVMDVLSLIAAWVFAPPQFRLVGFLMLAGGAYEQFAMMALLWFLGVNTLLLIVYVPLRLALGLLFRGAQSPPIEEPLPEQKPSLSDLPTVLPEKKRTLSDQPTVFPAENATNEPEEEEPKPAAKTSWTGWLVWLAIVVLAVALNWNDSDTGLLSEKGRYYATEVIVCIVAIFPIIALVTMLEQIVLIFLNRMVGSRVTSVVVGEGKVLGTFRLGSVLCGVRLSKPWQVTHQAYNSHFTPTRTQWLRLIGCLLVFHASLVAVALTLLWVFPVGKLVCIAFACMCVYCLWAQSGNWQYFRKYGGITQSVPLRILNIDNGLGRLRAVGDRTGEIIYLVDLSFLWGMLGNSQRAERLCQHLEAVPCDDLPDVSFVKGCRGLARGRLERERGNIAEAQAAFDEAELAYREAGASVALLMVDWGRAMLYAKQGDVPRAITALEEIMSRPEMIDRPTLRLSLLTDRIRAETMLPEATQLDSLLAAYEANRRLRPGPHFNDLDMRVYREVARYCARHGESTAVLEAHEKARAGMRGIENELGGFPRWLKLFQEGAAELREEIATSLEHAAQITTEPSNKRAKLAAPKEREVPMKPFPFLAVGWGTTVMNFVIALLIFSSVHVDPQTLKDDVEEDRNAPGWSAARRPTTQALLAGLLIMGLVPSLVCGFVLFVVGLVVPAAWGRGGRLLIGLAIFPWFIWCLHLSGYPPSGAGQTQPQRPRQMFPDDE